MMGNKFANDDPRLSGADFSHIFLGRAKTVIESHSRGFVEEWQLQMFDGFVDKVKSLVLENVFCRCDCYLRNILMSF